MLNECYSACSGCIQPNNMFACIGCKSTSLYYLSCQTQQIDTLSFVYITAAILTSIIMLLYFVQLLNGNGIFRETYENLQLTMIVSWGLGFQGGA